MKAKKMEVGDGVRQGERVAKVLSNRGLCSRREGERLMALGEVLLDGVPVRDPATRVAPDADLVIGRRGQRELAAKLTVLLHKPVGIVSTQPEQDQVPAWKLLTLEHAEPGQDPALVKRVVDKPWSLSVAGRLDRDSRGLLVLTQDGTIGRRLTAGGEFTKHYAVRVDGPLDEAALKRLNGPWELDGWRLKPMKVRRTGPDRLAFALREGRKHQIRRVCADCGLTVVDLLREGIGPWRLDGLAESHWRLAESIPAAGRTPAGGPRRGR